MHADQRRHLPCCQRHLFRRAIDPEAFIEQAHTVEVRIGVQAVAHHQVDAGILVQVDHLAVGVQAYVDVRVTRIKTPQARHQPQGGKRCGGGQCQVAGAALRAQGVDALRHLQQGPVQAVEQALPAVGEAYLAWQAFEQRQPQPALQGSNLMGDRRRRHRQLRRSRLETEQPRGCLEGAQGVERQVGEHLNSPENTMDEINSS
ncbi:hypothetical protein D3C76_1275460 [compost metagenome]